MAHNQTNTEQAVEEAGPKLLYEYYHNKMADVGNGQEDTVDELFGILDGEEEVDELESEDGGLHPTKELPDQDIHGSQCSLDDDIEAQDLDTDSDIWKEKDKTNEATLKQGDRAQLAQKDFDQTPNIGFSEAKEPQSAENAEVEEEVPLEDQHQLSDAPVSTCEIGTQIKHSVVTAQELEWIDTGASSSGSSHSVEEVGDEKIEETTQISPEIELIQNNEGQTAKPQHSEDLRTNGSYGEGHIVLDWQTQALVQEPDIKIIEEHLPVERIVETTGPGSTNVPQFIKDINENRFQNNGLDISDIDAKRDQGISGQEIDEELPNRNLSRFWKLDVDDELDGADDSDLLLIADETEHEIADPHLWSKNVQFKTLEVEEEIEATQSVDHFPRDESTSPYIESMASPGGLTFEQFDQSLESGTAEIYFSPVKSATKEERQAKGQHMQDVPSPASETSVQGLELKSTAVNADDVSMKEEPIEQILPQETLASDEGSTTNEDSSCLELDPEVSRPILKTPRIQTSKGHLASLLVLNPPYILSSSNTNSPSGTAKPCRFFGKDKRKIMISTSTVMSLVPCEMRKRKRDPEMLYRVVLLNKSED
ncbi:uncharacterized protein L203_106341 [Cryptococcus depauperatus CBS 7841]|uniref:Uncharacterized protein n=1 Tax=Cryptococcus depauperatus CBS 7841 TaxID=1295531 RepID=A0AAJ8JZ70_9TREE